MSTEELGSTALFYGAICVSIWFAAWVECRHGE